VNGEYAGVYELVEEIEKPMMGRVFGRDSAGRKRDGGYLFEYNWDENFNWTYPTDDLSFSELYDDMCEGLERAVLGRRVIAVPALRRLHLETLLACAASVSQPDQPAPPGGAEAPVSWFEAEVLRERAQILEAARADRRKPYTNDRIDEAHAEILSFARQRGAYVTEQVRRAIERGVLQTR
jgi:hypothetical protein